MIKINLLDKNEKEEKSRNYEVAVISCFIVTIFVIALHPLSYM